jgi:hypothetical protein
MYIWILYANVFEKWRYDFKDTTEECWYPD